MGVCETLLSLVDGIEAAACRPASEVRHGWLLVCKGCSCMQ